jgi:excisionase family DNA binding protein
VGTDELTVAQAAAELGMSATSVRSAISRGRLPARKRGPIWVIQRADLDAYRAGTANKGRPGSKPGGERRPPVPGTGPGTGPGHPADA